MKTVCDVLAQTTDPQRILDDLKEVLRTIDPAFSAEEEKYIQASVSLTEYAGSLTAPSVHDYLAAENQKIATELIYAGWLGFQFNLECFNNPINALMLRQDFEDLHRERRMHTLPAVQNATLTIDAFYRVLPEDLHELTAGVTSYYAYLQTTGYKLAHYFGFNFANQFLYYVLPGYSTDDVITLEYQRNLSDFLHVKIDTLGSIYDRQMSENPI